VLTSAEYGARSAEWSRRLSHSALRIPRSALPLAIASLAAAACLPRTLAPLHASRLGHRQAAQWLAARSQPDDAVLDTRGFTRFFSGRRTYDFPQGRRALRDPHLAYIVVEHRELEYDSRRGQTLRELLARGSRLMGRFAADSPGMEAVEVYQWGPSLGQGKTNTPVRRSADTLVHEADGTHAAGRTGVSALPVAARLR
jgi:hypothetical protein